MMTPGVRREAEKPTEDQFGNLSDVNISIVSGGFGSKERTHSQYKNAQGTLHFLGIDPAATMRVENGIRSHRDNEESNDDAETPVPFKITQMHRLVNSNEPKTAELAEKRIKLSTNLPQD